MSETAVETQRAFEIGLLNPVEVVTGWDLLYHGIDVSGLYSDPRQISRMLHDAIAGKIQLWLLKGRHEDGTLEFIGVLGSQVYYRPYSEVKALSLIHAGTLGDVADDEWMAVLKRLLAFGKAEGCGILEVFSDNPRVRDLMDKFGFRQSGLFVREV